MPEHSEILASLYASLYMQITVQKFPNQQLNYPPAIQCNSRPNEYSNRRESESLASTFIIFEYKKISNLLQNYQNRCLESTKYQQSPYQSPYSVLLGNQLYQQSRIRYFYSFVDEAAPGFELGKKDLQSPALPLGHAAKTIHNRIKNYRWITKLQFIVLASPFSSLNIKKL